ncbi:hypothetical protein MKX03_013273 [Papaver bracteatum]|nr:hypothetical protein MKX03_013273 [Papaver bracteatum]
MVEVLKDRLSEQCDGNSEAEHPLPYLTGCYRRANEEEDENQIKLDMGDTTKELVVSRSLMHLVDSVRATNRDKDYNFNFLEDYDYDYNYDFTELFKKNSETKSYLLTLLCSKVSRGKSLDCPNGFLEQLINESDFDTFLLSLSIVLTSLFEDLRSKIIKEDLCGKEPLKEIIYFVKNPICAKILVNHPFWNPKVTSGIELEKLSILGGFFNVSLIPDKQVAACISTFQKSNDFGLLSNSSEETTGSCRQFNSFLWEN